MLKRIRKSAHNYVFKVIFILLAFIFAIGLGDFSQTNIDTVATIGGQKIFLNDFLQVRQEANGQLDPNMPQAQKEMINYGVIMKMVTQSLVKQESESLGIKIDPEIIVEYIKGDHNFYNNGVFDLESYQKTLEYNNLSEDKLLSVISNQIASRFLLDSLVINLPLKATLSDYLLNYLSEKRSVSLITVDMSRKNIVNFSEHNLKDYYQKNQDSFKTKEYRSFSYLLLDPNAIKQNSKINEDDLISEYQENKEEYSLPETRDFYHFLAPSQEIVNQISNALKEGQDPTKVAKAFVSKKVIAEAFNNQPAQSFLSSLDLSLFSLNEEDTPPPIKSELGWHVFKILKINPKQYKSFSEARKEILENLQYKIAEMKINDLLKVIEDEVASGADFKDIATRNNIKFGEIKKISRDEEVSQMNAAILSLAFETPENVESEITMLDPAGYVIVKVDEIIPESIQSFEEAREKVKAKYLAQIKDEVALELTKKLAEDPTKLILEKAGNQYLNDKLVQEVLKPIYDKYEVASIDEAVITLKREEIVRPAVGRNNFSENFVNNLFQLELQKASNPEKLGDAKYAVAVVESVTSNDKLDQNIYGQIGSISEVNYKNEIYDQYVNYLKDKYKVRVYLDIINDYDSQ